MTAPSTPSHGYQATPRVSPGQPRTTGDATTTPTPPTETRDSADPSAFRPWVAGIAGRCVGKAFHLGMKIGREFDASFMDSLSEALNRAGQRDSLGVDVVHDRHQLVHDVSQKRPDVTSQLKALNSDIARLGAKLGEPISDRPDPLRDGGMIGNATRVGNRTVVHGDSLSSVVGPSDAKAHADSPSDDPAETRTTGPFRTLTDHLEDLIRVDEILARAFPAAVSGERIKVAIEITAALKWGAL